MSDDPFGPIPAPTELGLTAGSILCGVNLYAAAVPWIVEDTDAGRRVHQWLPALHLGVHRVWTGEPVDHEHRAHAVALGRLAVALGTAIWLSPPPTVEPEHTHP